MKKQYINFSAETTETAGAVVTTEENSVQIVSSAVNFQSIIEASRQLDESAEAVVITPLYFPFEKAGEKAKGVFVTVRDIQVTDEEATKDAGGEKVLKSIPAVVWMDSKQQMWLAAGVALVREVQSSGITAGTKIEITYKEKKGQVKIFTLGLL